MSVSSLLRRALLVGGLALPVAALAPAASDAPLAAQSAREASGTASGDATASTATDRPDPVINARIREEGTRRSQVLATARMLSDGFGPRLSGSPGYTAAAQWAVGELTRIGAARAWLEPWGTRGPAWSLERHSAELTAPFYLRLNALPKAWSRSIAGTLRGTPVQVPSLATALDRTRWAGRLRGRIVMLGRVNELVDTAARLAPAAERWTAGQLDSMSRLTEPGSPRTYWEDYDEWEEMLQARRTMLTWMRDEGVAAVVEPSGHELTLLSTQYNSAVTPRDANLPAFTVAREQYRRLQYLLDRGAPVTLELALAIREDLTDTVGVNVIAELAGRDPRVAGEVVMMGGHFDSWHAGSGATDNAAGSAVAIEAMRILVAIGAAPRRTIRLALWDGEEQEDYLGSAGYVRRHFGDHATMRLLPEHPTFSAYFNVDHGTGRIRGWYLQGNAAARPILAAYQAPWADLGATMLSIRNRGSTDNLAFTGVGLPGFNAIQDELDYETRTHHTALDGPGFLIEDDLKASAMVLASLVYHVANREGLMPRTPLPAPRAK